MFKSAFFSFATLIHIGLFSLSLQSMEVPAEEMMLVDCNNTLYPLLELPAEIRRRIVEFFIYNNQWRLEFIMQEKTQWENIRNYFWTDTDISVSMIEGNSHDHLFEERCQQILSKLLNVKYESMSFCCKGNGVLITTLGNNEVFYWDTQKRDTIQKCERELKSTLNASILVPSKEQPSLRAIFLVQE